MEPGVLLVMAGVAVGVIALFLYLSCLAIEWFLDAEHRALQKWLDNHAKQFEDDK